MKHACTIARRELMSFFFSPIAYVVLGLFALGTSLIFLNNYGPGQPAALRTTFDAVIWLMIFIVPAISMRLLSEELRSGSMELLMTAPVTDVAVVIGKWAGAMGFFLAIMSPFAVFYIVLECTGDPELGPLFAGMLGIVLVGAFYLAIGTFASAATQNQIIAFLVTIFIICLLTFLMFFLPNAKFVSPDWQEAMHFINVNHRFADFSKGLIDTSNLVYFITGTSLFLFLAVIVVQSRRWR